MTASAHDVALHACQMPYVLRTNVAAAGRGRRRALKWAVEWLQAGCPGVALPHPHAGWRSASVPAGGVALCDSDADRGFLWLESATAGCWRTVHRACKRHLRSVNMPGAHV